ncbi:MAG: DUF2752 domain-containing protein [Elusimicrobia bacterium]|nr:DUF2752 domain-containing protein [Elusimicrobiota bacterium]
MSSTSSASKARLFTLFDGLAIGAWLLLAAAAGVIKSGTLSPVAAEARLPFCLFKLWTGLPCPGCGMGHAILSAFAGDWAFSYYYHPLGLPVLGLWTWWLWRGARNLARGKPFSNNFPPAGRPALQWSFLALLLAVYLRNLLKYV